MGLRALTYARTASASVRMSRGCGLSKDADSCSTSGAVARLGTGVLKLSEEPCSGACMGARVPPMSEVIGAAGTSQLRIPGGESSSSEGVCGLDTENITGYDVHT